MCSGMLVFLEIQKFSTSSCKAVAQPSYKYTPALLSMFTLNEYICYH
jgi:hypothetical protein